MTITLPQNNVFKKLLKNINNQEINIRVAVICGVFFFKRLWLMIYFCITVGYQWIFFFFSFDLIHTFKQVIRDMRSIWTAGKEASAAV